MNPYFYEGKIVRVGPLNVLGIVLGRAPLGRWYVKFPISGIILPWNESDMRVVPSGAVPSWLVAE